MNDEQRAKRIEASIARYERKARDLRLAHKIVSEREKHEAAKQIQLALFPREGV